MERLSAPRLRPREQDRDGLNMLGVLVDECIERLEIVRRLVLLPRGAPDHPLRRDLILGFHGDQECLGGPWVVDEQILELLVYPTQPLDEPAHVVVPVLVGPDLLDDLPDSLAVGFRRLGGHPGDVTEILKERAVKTIEDDEVRLVWMPLSLASPPPEHLLKQDPRLHRAQEHQELEVWDVDPRGQQVDRYDDGRVGSVAELPDPLKRTIDLARDLGHKRIALSEEVARRVNELVRMRGTRKVVVREDQRLREPAELFLVSLGVLLEFFEDLAIRVRSCDVVLDL